MIQQHIRTVEASSLKTDVPHFEVGDTVDVTVKIIEGEKQREQVFTGTVIGRQGRGPTESFTVRRLVGNEGVERVFPIHSPMVAGVSVRRSGKTRRAKLYYLRDRVGKATRLKEVRGKGPTDVQTEAQQPEAAAAE
ncbi:MAG: 50S ribosomal protein L19 [Phycisphaerae bacterium]